MVLFEGLYELSDFLLSGKPLCAILVLIGAFSIVSALIPPVGNAIISIIPKLGKIDFNSVSKNQKIVMCVIGAVFVAGGIYGILTAPVPPEIESFIADKEQPQGIKTEIIWTATAFDKNGDPLTYKFYRMNNYSTGGRYISLTNKGNTYIWNVTPADLHRNFFRVNVTDGKFERSEEKTFDINEPNYPPKIDEIRPRVASPWQAGKNITFDVKAHDKENDKMFYKFWLIGPGTGDDWSEVTDWMETNHWTWQTSRKDVGNSTIKVWVIDNFHQGQNARDDNLVDDYKDITYEILNGIPVSRGNDSKNISISNSSNVSNIL
ncbi:MAG: hypothetical protein NTU95_03620 [Methanothrix sp.]|nr:hypothetical protein [Methanothrix sp.]